MAELQKDKKKTSKPKNTLIKASDNMLNYNSICYIVTLSCSKYT